MPWNQVPGKFKSGMLHSGGPGPLVQNKKQMLAIMLSEKAKGNPEYAAKQQTQREGNRNMAKQKRVNFEVINSKQVKEPYELLEEARKWHDDLAAAKIVLAWRKETRPDHDGHLVLGRCMKVTDLYKEFARYDFIIVLNQEVWQEEGFTREKKLALLDHELSHAAISMDKEGNTVTDERNRPVYRVRKHDVEEFYDVVERHGTYKGDLETFAQTLLSAKESPLFAALEPPAAPKARSLRAV